MKKPSASVQDPIQWWKVRRSWLLRCSSNKGLQGLFLWPYTILLLLIIKDTFLCYTKGIKTIYSFKDLIIIFITSCQKHLVLGWLNVPQWCYISCGRVKNMMECRQSCLVNLFSFHFWLMGNNIFCIYGVKLIPEYRSCCSNYVSLQCIVKVKWQLVAKVL